MISIASLSILHKKIQKISFRKNILFLGHFVVICCGIFIPIGISLAYYYHSNRSIALLEEQLLRLHKRYQTIQNCENRQGRYEKLYLHSNPAYLDTITKTIIPLKDEIEYLQMIIPFYPPEHRVDLQNRLHFLQHDNRFQFHETTRLTGSFLDEIIMQQSVPVELDIYDLQALLFCLEGIKDTNNQMVLIDRPQIFINHLDMYKKQESSLYDTFIITLQLMQREIKK